MKYEVTGRQVQELLDSINPDSLTYGDWFKVLGAAKTAGVGFNQLEDWCRRGDKFKHNDLSKRWAGIATDGAGIAGIGTLVQIAREHGYTGTLGDVGNRYTTFHSSYASKAKKRATALPERYDAMSDLQVEMLSKLPYAEQQREYLSALFKPDDYVSIATEAGRDEKNDKFYPKATRKLYRVSDLLKNPLPATAFNEAAGGWIRVNAILQEPISDGSGLADEDVSSFRYCLVESDTMPIAEQIKAYRKLNLPVACMVLSGGKSVHAVVKIDAEDKAEYDRRVREVLYPFLQKYGFRQDDANKNCSRFTRLPGVKRGSKEQLLIGLASGPDSWEDWDYWREEIEMGLPPLDDASDITGENLPPLLPEVIEGTLRLRDIMSVSGGSKSSKTFLLIELAVAVATGGEWLGRKCKRGPCLYLNMEVNRAVFAHRLEAVQNAMGLTPANTGGFLKVHNLRGKKLTIEDIERAVNHYARRTNFSLIILDPLYKILNGRDENKAGDVSDLFNYFNAIAESTGASFIFAHHHSKGSQSGKSAQDRGSGSGVFSRDPDVMLDMLELEIPADVKENLEFDEDETALQYTWVMRGYPPKKPETGFFKYPIHSMDKEGLLKGARALREAQASDARRRNARKPIDWKRLIDTVYSNLLEASEKEGCPYPGKVQAFTLIQTVMDRADAGETTTKKRIQEAGYSIGRAKGGLPAFVTVTPLPTAGIPESDGTSEGIHEGTLQGTAETVPEAVQERLPGT